MIPLATYQRLTTLSIDVEVDGATASTLVQSFAEQLLHQLKECGGTLPDLGRWCGHLEQLANYKPEAKNALKVLLRTKWKADNCSAEAASTLCTLLRSLLANESVASRRYDALLSLPLPVSWSFDQAEFRLGAAFALCHDDLSEDVIGPLFEVSLAHLESLEKPCEYESAFSKFTKAYEQFFQRESGASAPRQHRRRRKSRSQRRREREENAPAQAQVQPSFLRRMVTLFSTIAFVGAALFGLSLYVQESGPARNFQKPAASGKPPSFGRPFQNSIGQKFLWLENGTFTQGSMRENETPSHEVIIKKGFWMAANEVTQGEYELIMGENPSCFPGPNNPVEQVSWLDAMSFCRKLTKRERKRNLLPAGYVYSLPPESLWEYGCRAFSQTDTYAGPHENDTRSLDEVVERIAWYVKNSSLTKKIKARPIRKGIRVEKHVRFSTRPVGKKTANGFGLHDMLGNVQEWTLDTWRDTYDGAPTNGRPWLLASKRYRVCRGGAWNNEANRCLSSSRVKAEAMARKPNTGFRVIVINEQATLQ